MRKRVYQEQGVSILPMPAPGAAPPARTVVEHSLIYGSPATVAEKLAQVGGHRHRRPDHAVPSWPDVLRRHGAQPDAVRGKGAAATGNVRLARLLARAIK